VAISSTTPNGATAEIAALLTSFGLQSLAMTLLHLSAFSTDPQEGILVGSPDFNIDKQSDAGVCCDAGRIDDPMKMDEEKGWMKGSHDSVR